MSPQKDVMTTKLAPEQLMEDKDNQWILGSPMIISRMGSPSASIATSMVIWQRNANQKRRDEKHKHILNATKRSTLPRTVKESR